MQVIATLSSDLILKSPPVRRKFQRILLNNLRRTFKLKQISYKMEIDLGHIFLSSEHEEALKILERTFGIESLSPIDGECESTLDKICEQGVALYKNFVRTGTYAIRAKRKGTHEFTSEEVNRQLGSKLKTEENSVNIKNSEHPIFVYIKCEKTYFFTKKIKASGGLPLGTGGKSLCLVSGGFDSILASWLIQKRGIQVDYLFCNLGGKAYQRSVLEITKKLVDLWGHGSQPKFYTFDFDKLVKEVREKTKPAFNQVVLKRLFYKAAKTLCRKYKYDAIITGEALGQVSSQTLKNLRAIESGLDTLILRPLISFNKSEIIHKCQEIGTYELSSKIAEFCQITKEKPVTGTSRVALDAQFEKLDPNLLEETFKNETKVLLTDQNLNLHEEDYFTTLSIPEDAILLDCRSEKDAQEKPILSAEWTAHHLFENLNRFSKDKTYVLFCVHSTQSLLFAEKMQKEGFSAYALKGGEKTLLSMSSRQACA